MGELLRQMGAVFGWCRQVWWRANGHLQAGVPPYVVRWEKVEEWNYRLLYWPPGDIQGYPPQRYEQLAQGYYAGLRDPNRGRHWNRRRNK